MAVVHFYEKPGCAGNKRQRELLLEAGHILFVHDLLRQPWAETPDKLRSFFGDLPVADWFNRSAPAIKNGEVLPEALDEAQAIALMIADPLLIRRPLLEADGRRRAGFDTETVEAWLEADMDGQDLESCPKRAASSACGS
ncbi:ArsC/Spx/MgsR family protein [Methylomicrobium sp. RS1]|uniref:ArsC/Spx/MgsR family protein n=1 Tax=Candidatus Methylomicrobium oryzae TaxID=2802053 RepID=UPI0019238668|nr:ArsC/Spx/MgsR family protein [Methylomicrobium sp. RS1]MBL1265709.1 nitrogenase-associated protein [Methylomicrobium sp. RS1]